MEKYNNINIIKLNNEGMGLCEINNKVTFIPFALANENIDLKINKEHKNYNEGECIKINAQSKYRIKPICKYYYECGGCNLMHLDYNEELMFKKEKVINNLKHIGNIEVNNDIEIVSKNEYNYRNHITLNIKNDKIGFYKNNTNNIVDIDSCSISNVLINKKIAEIRKFLLKYKNNEIKKISIKSYDEILINIIGDFKLINEFKSLVTYDSLYINNIFIDGNKNIITTLGNMKYKVSSSSFFQKNSEVAKELYDYIKLHVNNSKNVLDLYCGVGSITIYTSNCCNHITGIEEISSAIEDAKENALINEINNINFICGKVEDNIDNFKNIDLIIVDPPRCGLDKKTINNIIKINPKKIIYVSCNSTTLARDLKLLKNNYEINKIKLFDMFPNTHHVESVCILNYINN